MLALTAIHDIMKIQALVPRVALEHAPFGTYKANEEIGDHDLALAYVLEHYPNLMPSFHTLPQESQQVVLFTQSKLEFNNGWLVQAEAPPGKILRVFKDVLRRGGVLPQDVAFYFVHWFTDLAGAVPTPLVGSEKFAVQFPHAVLDAFVKSFGIVKRLADQCETEVFEDYLRMRWADTKPSLMPLASDGGAEVVCKCRLLCMAQGSATPVLDAFEQLPLEDRLFMSREMALTGRAGQAYKVCTASPADRSFVIGGPAFLLYYAPALLQRGLKCDAYILLQMLKVVIQAGRLLWPFSREKADETVTLRIDTLKETPIDEVRRAMQTGEVWVLVRHGDSEAFVERHPLHKLRELNHQNREYHLLYLLTAQQVSRGGRAAVMWQSDN